MSAKRYICIEQPDRTATIDFLSFGVDDDNRVERVTVKAKLDYDKRSGKAALNVFIVDVDTCDILLDVTLPVSVSKGGE